MLRRACPAESAGPQDMSQDHPASAPEPVPPADRPPDASGRQPDPSPPGTLPTPPGALPSAGSGEEPSAGASRRSPAHTWLRTALVALGALIGSLVAQSLVGLAILLALPSAPMSLALGGGTLAAIAFLIAWWLLVARESLPRLGLPPRPRRIIGGLLMGFLGGCLLMALIVVAGLPLGAWSIEVADDVAVGPLLGWTLVLLFASAFEEILFRGILMQELGQRWLLVGIIVSSLVFGGIHLGNPATQGRLVVALLLLNITLAGVLLAAAFLQSRDLWLPTGLHLGWNWAQGLLFGLPVSGLELPSVLRGSMSADAPRGLASPFGPESSLITTLVIGLIAIPWLVVLLRRGARLPVNEVTDVNGVNEVSASASPAA